MIALSIVMIINLIVLGVLVTLLILGILALIKYIRRKDGGPETRQIRKNLGETLRAYRMERNMTQEFVAEKTSVSRQAVSKWETGTSEPCVFNLMALAKLYGVAVEELLGVRGAE